MPFTMDGQWIPSKTASSGVQKPVKVRLVKRGKNLLTVILNLVMTQEEMLDLSSSLKKKLGCGGAVKEDEVVIQGDKVAQVVKSLAEIGIKSS